MIHIEKYYWERDMDGDNARVIAFCGAEAEISPDASISPPDFDFVSMPDIKNLCTCVPCKEQVINRAEAHIVVESGI